MRRAISRYSRSEAFAEAATTLARREKEKIKEEILASRGKPSPFAAGSKYSAAFSPAAGTNQSAVAAEEQEVARGALLNRKTGLPLYQAQPVKSSAHVFKEYKKAGIPMPPTASVAASTPRGSQPYVLPAFVILGIAAALSYYTSQTQTSVAATDIMAGALRADAPAGSLVPTAGGKQDSGPPAEFEGETLTVAQQPLWLQRQR